MNKCFKMVALESLLEADALFDGMPVGENARRSHRYITRSSDLRSDISKVGELKDVTSPDATWERYWVKNPLSHWGPWFAVEDDRVVSGVPRPTNAAEEQALLAMTVELVDYRLAQYRMRLREKTQVDAAGEVSSFRLKVLTNKRDPILHFGNRKDRDTLPAGETDVRLPDGSPWQFRFMKIACNVARPVGVQRNQLGDLLRRWFGPDAGKAGTDFHVDFRRSPDGWWVEPVGAKVIALPARGHVAAYPSLRAAAGEVLDDVDLQGAGVQAEEVRLPIGVADPDVFAVRATGDSMDGGKSPIRDGDWVLMKWARGKGLGAVRGRVALVGVGDPAGERQFLLKRVVETEQGQRLRSENRDYPELAATPETQVVALQEGVVRPEDLAPAVGAVLSDAELTEAFGVGEAPQSPWSRVDGHLFVFVTEPGALLEPDRLRFEGAGHRPGETAFVLAKWNDDSWRYAGVARWREKEGAWALPPVDFTTWRGLGKGRSASRRLPSEWAHRAEELVTALASRSGTWFEARSKRCRLVGPSARGGVRIDGGPEGFKERTVSPIDLAWVLMARDVIGSQGGVVDEATVNRLRYLDGTPRSSTRWIDTGWALVLTESP